jgi:hypothetical protein
MDKVSHMANTEACGVSRRAPAFPLRRPPARPLARPRRVRAPPRARVLQGANVPRHLLPPPKKPPARPQKFTPKNVEFQGKILARSGLGDDTYLPPGLKEKPPAISMSDARWEFEQVGCAGVGGGPGGGLRGLWRRLQGAGSVPEGAGQRRQRRRRGRGDNPNTPPHPQPASPPKVCFSSIKEVLGKAGVQPRQVGVVIVNCSLFNPTPSLSAMIMNHFKMGSNTINYNLGGMGCSGERAAGAFRGACFRGSRGVEAPCCRCSCLVAAAAAAAAPHAPTPNPQTPSSPPRPAQPA